MKASGVRNLINDVKSELDDPVVHVIEDTREDIQICFLARC